MSNTVSEDLGELDKETQDILATLWLEGKAYGHEHGYGDMPAHPSEVPALQKAKQAIASKLRQVETEARVHEREHMKFIQSDGTETHIPFTQYRFTGDGLLLDWEDRSVQLQAILTPTNKKGKSDA